MRPEHQPGNRTTSYRSQLVGRLSKLYRCSSGSASRTSSARSGSSRTSSGSACSGSSRTSSGSCSARSGPSRTSSGSCSARTGSRASTGRSRRWRDRPMQRRHLLLRGPPPRRLLSPRRSPGLLQVESTARIKVAGIEHGPAESILQARLARHQLSSRDAPRRHCRPDHRSDADLRGGVIAQNHPSLEVGAEALPRVR